MSEIAFQCSKCGESVPMSDHVNLVGRLFVIGGPDCDDANDGSSVERAVKTEKRLWELIDLHSTPVQRDIIYVLGVEDG